MASHAPAPDGRTKRVAMTPSGAGFVAREFARNEVRDDLFAPSSTHNTSRLIDFVAMKRLRRFILYCVHVYLQVPEQGEVIVDPPP